MTKRGVMGGRGQSDGRGIIKRLFSVAGVLKNYRLIRKQLKRITRPEIRAAARKIQEADEFAPVINLLMASLGPSAAPGATRQLCLKMGDELLEARGEYWRLYQTEFEKTGRPDDEAAARVRYV